MIKRGGMGDCSYQPADLFPDLRECHHPVLSNVITLQTRLYHGEGPSSVPAGFLLQQQHSARQCITSVAVCKAICITADCMSKICKLVLQVASLSML